MSFSSNEAMNMALSLNTGEIYTIYPRNIPNFHDLAKERRESDEVGTGTTQIKK
jgi:hypothetical protein